MPPDNIGTPSHDISLNDLHYCSSQGPRRDRRFPSCILVHPEIRILRREQRGTFQMIGKLVSKPFYDGTFGCFFMPGRPLS